MLKKEKIEFVNNLSKEIKGYKLAGIMPIDTMPDRLVQKIRNGLKPDTRFIIARKKLILRALEASNMKLLENHVNGNVALILSNEDPFKLYNKVSSSSLKLIAKPNQISSSDIAIDAGDTTIAPGQAVTDLKTAGIDVQIQKGKVVIAKPKVIVQKGAKISVAVSKALKMLDIYPFEARGRISAMVYDKLLYSEDVLKINRDYVTSQLIGIFASTNALTMQIGYITQYNVSEFIRRAFLYALELGLETQIYEGEVVMRLLGIAAQQAKSVNSQVKE